MTFFSGRSLLISALIVTTMVSLQGCDQPPTNNVQETTASDHEATSQITDQAATDTPSSDFKSGNFFYIARDVADLQPQVITFNN